MWKGVLWREEDEEEGTRQMHAEAEVQEGGPQDASNSGKTATP